MPLTTRPTSLSLGLKTLSASVACAVLMISNASAAGLGKLTVLSALGQPLRAEIELTSVAPDEAGALVAKLAPADAFRQVNIDFNPALLSLRFAVESRGNRQFIRVSSSQPINEPFVDMLLELTWNGGRLVREYTFLLDPSDLKTSQPPQVAAPFDVPALAKPAASASASAASPAPVAETPGEVPVKPRKSGKPVKVKPEAKPKDDAEAKPESKPESKPAGENAASSYEVKKGDTLGKIASQVRGGSGVSLDQMLVALYRANESAFVGNNMNRLRSGQILQVPDADAVRNIAQAEAHSVVLAHSNDFNGYRNKLAGQVATAEPTKVAEPKQSTSGGKITTKVEERPTAANAASDKLKLSNSITGSSASASKSGKSTSVEDKIAKEKASAENAKRVKELEKNVADLKRIAEMKAAAVAEQERKALELKAAKDAAEKAAFDKRAADKAAAEKAAADKVAAKAAADKAAADKLAADKAAAEAKASASAPAASASPAPVATPSPTPVATPTPTPVVKPKRLPPPPPAPVPEPSMLDSIPGGLTTLGGLGALIALLGGWVFYKRKKKPEQKFDTSSMMGDSSMQANSMFGSTGGQSVDTNNSVFNSNFAPSASQLDTNEVDPVAEADVYIAYGRDVQAEEILKEALRTQPERNAVRLKLLEIYANRKDMRSFEVQASELYSITHGEGDDWAQAASMGMSIDPNNPLYAGADNNEATVIKPAPVMHAATEPLEDLDPEALLVSTQQPGLTLDKAGSASDLDLDLSAAAASEDEFDFNLDELNAEPAPVVEAAPVAAAAPVEEEDHVLDFDLGGLTFEPVKPGASVAAAPVAPPPAPALPDLDLSEFMAEPAAPAAEPVVQAAPAPAPVMDDLAMDDFDLNIDLPGSAMAPAEPAELAAAPVVPTLGEDDFDLGSMDFGLPPEPAATTTPVAAVETEPSLDDFFATPKLDLGDEDQTVLGSTAAAPAAAQEFDLSGIDLDLSGGEPVAQIDQEKLEAFAVGDDPSADQVEMDTKLDLAIAYQEIGDKEGARELIDEVIKGGTPEQIEKAKAMRAKLA